MGCQLGSIYLLITVSGRTVLYVYFASQHSINASNIVIDVLAYAYTVSSKSAFAFCAAIPIMLCQWPVGENFFVPNITWPFTLSLKGLSSQKLAISSCSGVRWSM